MIIAKNINNGTIKCFSSVMEAREMLNLRCADDIINLALKGIICSIDEWEFNKI